LALSLGGHDVLVATVSSSDDWGFVISGAEFRQPYPVKGCSDAWLYLGPFDALLSSSPAEIQANASRWDLNPNCVRYSVILD